MEQAIEFMLGVTFTTLGLSYVVRTNAWIAWFEHLKGEHRRGSLSIGALCLLLGTFIVGFHWAWKGIPLITTVIGVICVAKGVIYLLFPQWLPIKIKLLEKHFVPVLRISGLIMVGIGLVVIHHWSVSSGLERFKELKGIFFDIAGI